MNFTYTVDNDDDRERRSQYREQIHYAKRYTGLTGGFFTFKDGLADSIGEGGRQFALSAFLLALSIAIISMGWSWWFFLWVPMALFMAASCVMLIASVPAAIKKWLEED